MSYNMKNWPNITICILATGVFALGGFLLRTPIFVGCGLTIINIFSYAVYIFCYSYIVLAIVDKYDIPPMHTIISFIICGVAACVFYCVYQLCTKDLLWILLIPLPEIAAVMISALFHMDQADHRRQRIIYTEGAYIILLVAMIWLFTRDAVAYSPFYFGDTRARAVLVHDALKTTNAFMTILSIAHCLLLLIMDCSKAKNGIRSVIATRVLLFSCLLFLFVGFKAIIVPEGSIAVYYNRESEGVVESDNQYGLYCKEYQPVCRLSGSRPDVNTVLTNVAPDSIELYEKYKGKLLAKFSSTEGWRWIRNVDQKDYVSDYANEVILLRDNDDWKAYYTKELKDEPANALLTEAIWDSVDKGYLLLAVYASDYLEKNDADEFIHRVCRWSHGIFTAGESAHFALYDKQAVINWAKREL